ncbi:MAG: hypothetical protein VB064_13190 [Oscillospiraceae bacterium]|nr:hypothetical protein [Oscillospiraceae bacterium]
MKSKRPVENNELGSAQNRKAHPDLSPKSNSELLNELEEKMSAMTEDDFDFELVEQHLKVLQDRAPVMTDYDESAEFDRLQNEHSGLFDENIDSGTPNVKRRKKAARFLRITEVAVAAVLCLTISANAFDFNPIKMLINWMEDVLQVQSGPSGLMELPEGSGNEYKSLDDALSSKGADSGGCPTWIPTDYSLLNVSVKSSELVTNFVAYYSSNRGDIIIEVTKFNSNWNGTSEKNPGGYIYEHSGYEYYIVSNFEDSKAGWTSGSSTYLIDGKITEKEIKKMIDSIQREH